MTKRPLSERLQEVQDRLESGHIGDKFAEGFNKPFERMQGEIIIEEPGAPDRADYEEMDNGYAHWLVDIHEWVLDDLEEAIEGYQAVADHLDADGRPDLTEQSPGDDDRRDDFAALVEAAEDVTERLQDAHERVERIEDAYRER